MTHSLTLRPAFTPLTILLMVLGFIFFWPLGLIMLAYMLWGNRFHEFGARMEGYRRGWSRDFGGCSYHRPSSGNLAFDEYRLKELRRLEEERRRLDDERREFEAFMRNLRMAKDQEEFDRFMRQRRAVRPDETTDI